MSLKPPSPLPPDTNEGPTLLILTCILTSCSIITTSLRYWVRYAQHQLKWDDHLILIVTLLAIARTGLQIASVAQGNGRHIWYLSQPQNQWVVMATWYTQLILFPTICMLKVSIFLLLLRIWNTPVILVWARVLMAGLVVTNGIPIVVLLAECTPVETYWEPTAGICWNPKIRIYSIYVQAGYSILTDLVCSLMPIIVFYNLRIARKDKILLCGLMSLGLIATVCAAIRASSLGISTVDLSYEYCIAAIWANTELHLGIIAANAACSRAIFKYFRSLYFPSPPDPNLSHTGYVKTSESHLSRSRTTATKSDLDEEEGLEIEIPPYPNIRKVSQFTTTVGNQSQQQLVEMKNDSIVPKAQWLGIGKGDGGR